METKELKLLAGSESYGGNHACNAQVILNSNLFDELSKDKQDDMNWAAQKFIEQLRYKIELAHAEENQQEERKASIEKMKDLFHKAGFDMVYATTIENQYSDHPGYYKDPWLEVTTSKGVIIIGWRKRVINIDWSKSDITKKAEELFPQESSTKGDHYIHAWGYDKAVDYLTILAEENE